MRRLPAELQTLYAELSERMRSFEAARTFAHLTGGFAKKRVNSGEYWYFKTSGGLSGQREYFVGPDNADTRRIMQAYAADRPEVESMVADIARLCAMLRQGGINLVDAASAKILSGLANAGVFRVGAVLVGTHAYVALGNLLGVRWSSNLRTQDNDIAAHQTLQVAVPQSNADLPKTIESLQMGFLPVPGLRPQSSHTSFKVRGQSLRVDLLTPASAGHTDRPVNIPRLNAAAQPLEMLDYLLEAPLSTPVVNGGASLVNVPQPARFALHKIALSGFRHSSEQMKAQKDFSQATEMIALLHEDRPGDLELAAKALRTRSKKWTSKVLTQLRRLPTNLTAARAAIASALRA